MVALGVAVSLAGGVPGVALAVSDREAVTLLNEQRAFHGLPPSLELDAKLSTGCDRHNNYLSQNEGAGSHGEDPGRPGYTPEGAGTAPGYGGAEVIAGGFADWDGRWVNPWKDAPLHLLLMFNPTAARAGYADSYGKSCMRLSGRAEQPGAIYSVPGPGTTNVPVVTESGGESPYSPADVAGTDDFSGYNILLFRTDGTLDVARASLRGQRGPVEVKVVDPTSPTPDGGTFWWGGSVVIPVAPLDADSRYQLDVAFADGTPHQVEFTTESVRNDLSVSGSYDAHTGGIAVRTLTALQPKVWLIAPGGQRRDLPVTGPPVMPTGVDVYNGEYRWKARTTAADVDSTGVWRACATSGGAGTPLSAATRCDRFRVRPRHSVRFRRRGGRIIVTAGRWTAGRRVTVLLEEGRMRCRRVAQMRQCASTITGRRVTRTVRPRPTASLKLPPWGKRRGRQVWVSLSVPAARVRGERVPRFATRREEL